MERLIYSMERHAHSSLKVNKMWRESPLMLKMNKEVFVYKNKQAQVSQSSLNQGENNSRGIFQFVD